MLSFDNHTVQLQGPEGTLSVPEGDEITRKLAMLFEGQCEGLGPVAAARKFGYSKQRYYQLLQAFSERGALAPDGHLKIPHLWPGQNPPGDSRGIGYRQSVSRSILIPFSSADFLFAGQPDGGLFEAVAAAFKLEQVAAVQEPVQHRR